MSHKKTAFITPKFICEKFSQESLIRIIKTEKIEIFDSTTNNDEESPEEPDLAGIVSNHIMNMGAKQFCQVLTFNQLKDICEPISIEEGKSKKMVLQKYLKDTLLDQGLESFLIQNKFSNELLISFLGSLGAAPLSDNSTELIHQIGRNVNYLGMQVILTKYENHFLFTLCQELGLSVPENQKQALINAICTLDDGHPSSSTSASSTSKASTKKQTPVKPTVHASPQAEIKKTTVVVSTGAAETTTVVFLISACGLAWTFGFTGVCFFVDAFEVDEAEVEEEEGW